MITLYEDSNYIHFSNGDMYDPDRFIYIQIDNSKPSPQNRIQTLLIHLNIQDICDLWFDELDYLMKETREYKASSVDQQPWYKASTSARLREYRIHQLQHDYWWEVCTKTHYKYTKEQLDKMSWAESRHKKHERVLGPTMWEWVERYRPNQFHALWGKRKTLPGVIKFTNKATKYFNKYGQSRRVSPRVGTRNTSGKLKQYVRPKARQNTVPSVSRTTARSSRNVRKTWQRTARIGNHRR